MVSASLNGYSSDILSDVGGPKQSDGVVIV